jgi:hypothetical protein
MAKLMSTPRIELNVQLELTAHEAEALHALTLYGTDEFLTVFYENLGRSYLSPHECGLRILFKNVREIMPNIIKRYNDARSVLSGDSEVTKRGER